MSTGGFVDESELANTIGHKEVVAVAADARVGSRLELRVVVDELGSNECLPNRCIGVDLVSNSVRGRVGETSLQRSTRVDECWIPVNVVWQELLRVKWVGWVDLWLVDVVGLCSVANWVVKAGVVVGLNAKE